TDSESAAFLKGLSTGVQGLPPPFALENIYPAVEQFVSDRRQKADAEFKQKQLTQNDEFFVALKKKTNVVFLPDGLAYEILQAGTGAFPQTNQIAKVNYTGRLISGRIFDATDPSLGPLDIDPNTVIVGWREGIQKINRGGKIRLYIPPTLGYGDANTSGIPPYSTLVFEVELLSLSDPQPATSLENK
ncbi:MAG TPA: FKBP-type peptidyl-prolyl cis-trans isomerase, partial [Verrucomicrobiae bacterium]|nr:FKBP-type peptidyl-prolyl cis-trans isomerase [Verrucomicrobiae bacterium]